MLDVVPSGTKVGTFDVGGSIKLIQSGKMMFAIDQQQYLQGYLPVVFAMLYATNLNTVGNGAPVLTGPGIINKANAARMAALAAKGTPLGRPTGPAVMAAHPPAAEAVAETTTDTGRRASRPTVGPLARILTRPDIGAFLGAVAVWFAFAYFARERQLDQRSGIAAGWTDQAAQFGIVAGARRAADDRRRVRPLRRRDDRQLGPPARLPRPPSRT